VCVKIKFIWIFFSFSSNSIKRFDNDRYENVAARSAQLKAKLLKAKEKSKYDDMKKVNEFEYSHTSKINDNDNVDDDNDNEFDDEAYQREMLKKHVEALRQRDKLWGGRDEENIFESEEEHDDFEGKRNDKRYDDDDDDNEEEEGEDVD
jgi:hypothetical protein